MEEAVPDSARQEGKAVFEKQQFCCGNEGKTEKQPGESRLAIGSVKGRWLGGLVVWWFGVSRSAS